MGLGTPLGGWKGEGKGGQTAVLAAKGKARACQRAEPVEGRSLPKAKLRTQSLYPSPS